MENKNNGSLITKTWDIDLAEIGKVFEDIREEIVRTLPEEKRMAAAIVFEETVMNIAKYAYEHEGTKFASVHFCRNEKYCLLSFSDSGKEFDPAAYVPQSPDDMQVGGHGIRLIKALSDTMRYHRTEDGRNVLEIVIYI